MNLRFRLCACERHGRLIGARGTVPIEVGSREMANAHFEEAERNGVFAPGGLEQARRMLAASMLVVKDDWIDAALRERIVLWNLAAAAVGNPDAFAQTDFHAYHAMIDDLGKDDPQPF